MSGDKFKLGDKAIWEHNKTGTIPTKYRKSIFMPVTVIEVNKGSYVIQFDGTIKTKRVNKNAKWLRPL